VLFQAVIQQLCDLHVKKNTAVESIWQGSPAEVLHKVGERRFAFFLNLEEVALYRVIIGALEHFPKVGQMYYDLSFAKTLDLLGAYFQELDQQGVLQIPQPQSSACAFLALLQGQLIARAWARNRFLRAQRLSNISMPA
jgi:hypothetical protein